MGGVVSFSTNAAETQRCPTSLSFGLQGELRGFLSLCSSVSGDKTCALAIVTAASAITYTVPNANLRIAVSLSLYHFRFIGFILDNPVSRKIHRNLGFSYGINNVVVASSPIKPATSP
jgi:hypothetical protein